MHFLFFSPRRFFALVPPYQRVVSLLDQFPPSLLLGFSPFLLSAPHFLLRSPFSVAFCVLAPTPFPPSREPPRLSFPFSFFFLVAFSIPLRQVSTFFSPIRVPAVILGVRPSLSATSLSSSLKLFFALFLSYRLELRRRRASPPSLVTARAVFFTFAPVDFALFLFFVLPPPFWKEAPRLAPSFPQPTPLFCLEESVFPSLTLSSWSLFFPVARCTERANPRRSMSSSLGTGGRSSLPQPPILAISDSPKLNPLWLSTPKLSRFPPGGDTAAA